MARTPFYNNNNNKH
uniref:Uncharacterized protein n=1 Tax=Amphimedon queenslandica TaxID=400682 RepID=A0A1X7VAU5_AMPQE